MNKELSEEITKELLEMPRDIELDVPCYIDCRKDGYSKRTCIRICGGDDC